jgi:arylsulfatase A-like enzyme
MAKSVSSRQGKSDMQYLLRHSLRLLLLAAISLPLVAAAAQPNILWLISEDMGLALGCYGQKNVATPNLDQMAANGARYTHFYTTAPVCSPSRSAFMTGMYATTIGAHQHRTPAKKPLPDGVHTLPEWMRAAGYFTGNLRTLPQSFGFSGAGKTDWNFQYDPKTAFDSADWADLKSHQPFFAQINFKETHRKFNAPAKADPAKIELPPYYPDHPVTRQDYANYLDSATELDRKIGLVLAQLEQDGLASNTIVVFMGDNGEAHVRGKQFCYEEGLHVPLLVRWPAAFAAPQHFRKGSVDDRLLEAIDLAPTFIALAGAPVPPKMQGKPFLGDQAGAAKEYVFGARDRCDETTMRLRTVRDARYRYIRNFTPEVPFLAPNDYKERSYPVWNLLKELNAAGKLTTAQAALCAPRQAGEELYDLQADPHEIVNLVKSDQPEHQAALKRLRGALEKWITDSDDQGRFPEVAAPAVESKKAEAKAQPKKKKQPKKQP